MSLRRFLGILLVAGATLLSGAVLADLYLFPWLVHSQAEVLVPVLADLTQDEAEEALDRLGLHMILGDELFDETRPPGVVLEQQPKGLTHVRRGRPVRVSLSKGEALVRVPNLSGMSLRQSELTLAREGLVMGRVARSYDPAGGSGVVAQRPAAGIRLVTGSPVTILVREGHDRVHHLMPDLVGRSVSRAREELLNAGFELRRVTYREDRDAFPGTILDQWPSAGFRLPSGGSIELVAASRG